MGKEALAEILCIGELLWDELPEGLFLGGAPFNVACHLSAAGATATIVSRVGRDHLGDEALRQAAQHGVRTDLMQTDESLPTGVVKVTIGGAGNAEYEILAPAAWDAIAPDGALIARAAGASAIVFGSLAQRNALSRATIARCLESPALKVFDINLRRPFHDPEVVRYSLGHADVVKLSAEEMEQVAEWFGFNGTAREIVSALAGSFDCSVVCVTCGAEGAMMWREGRWAEHPGYTVQVQDTVGAGDAFLATLLAGLLADDDDRDILQRANRVGADVATQSGALPPL